MVDLSHHWQRDALVVAVTECMDNDAVMTMLVSQVGRVEDMRLRGAVEAVNANVKGKDNSLTYVTCFWSSKLESFDEGNLGQKQVWILPHETATPDLMSMLKLDSRAFTYENLGNDTIKMREAFAVRRVPHVLDFAHWSSRDGLADVPKDDFWERRQFALKGLKVRASHLPFPPMTIIDYDSSGQIIRSYGMFPEVIKQVQVKRK